MLLDLYFPCLSNEYANGILGGGGGRDSWQSAVLLFPYSFKVRQLVICKGKVNLYMSKP
jgi:hypothetical protein